MKDFLGNELNIGDAVIFANKSYRELERGKIVKITPCFVFISYEKFTDFTIKQTGAQIIKIPV